MRQPDLRPKRTAPGATPGAVRKTRIGPLLEQHATPGDYSARPLTRRELRDLDVDRRRELIFEWTIACGYIGAIVATVTPVAVWMLQ
jgi:hypothetical protein